MFIIFTTICLPILEGLSCLATIWGVCHVAQTTDMVITYGASGPGAPDIAMWMNSYGSIVMGIVTFVASYFAKSKCGLKSEIYLAGIYYITHPGDKMGVSRLFLAAMDELVKVFPAVANDKDVTDYIRKWVLGKYMVVEPAVAVTTPVVTPVGPAK